MYRYKKQKYPEFQPESLKIAEKIMTVVMLGLAVPAILTSPYGLYNLTRGAINYYFHKKDFHREIKRLQRNDYVALTKTPDGWIIRLLKKGRKRFKTIQMQNLKLTVEKNWDGKWRLFIFDIPEKERQLRDYLRKKLKQLGMHNIQRSVFAYPYDCRKELEFLSDYYRLSKYTTYAEVNYMDIDRELRNIFKLPRSQI